MNSSSIATYEESVFIQGMPTIKEISRALGFSFTIKEQYIGYKSYYHWANFDIIIHYDAPNNLTIKICMPLLPNKLVQFSE